MSKDNKINMPSGMGGLVRYFNESNSIISFKPAHVIIMAILFMGVILILHAFGRAWLGF